MMIQMMDDLPDRDVVGLLGDRSIKLFQKARPALLHRALFRGRITMERPYPITDAALHRSGEPIGRRRVSPFGRR